MCWRAGGGPELKLGPVEGKGIKILFRPLLESYKIKCQIILGDRGNSKKDGKDQETIQSSTTPDPGYHMGK